MLGWIRQHVPSMFQRRLLLLLLAAIGVVGIMLAKMAHLTVVQGATMRKAAEDALLEGTLVPTVRGRILDRKQRVLAMDRPSYDIAVQYEVISGAWAYDRAYKKARKATVDWPELEPNEREKLIAREQQFFDDQTEVLWRTLCEVGGVSREDLERRKAEILEKVMLVSSHLRDQTYARRQRELEDPGTLADAAQSIREENEAHEVLSSADPDVLLRIKRLIALSDGEPGMEVWKKVSVAPSKQRDYPLETMEVAVDCSTLPTPLQQPAPRPVMVEGVGMQMLGTLRRIWQEDTRAEWYKPFSLTLPGGEKTFNLRGYLPGDQLGAWGVESAYESTLRGARGRNVRHLDTNVVEVTEPVAGGDVALTIDVQLQARIQALMDPAIGLLRVQEWHTKDPEAVDTLKPNKPKLHDALNGAAVVLDIETGEVLAAVSTPSLSLQKLRTNPDSIWRDQAQQPYVNRALARAFQPGSTVKPLVLAAAITDRELAYNEHIECGGHLFPNDTNHFRCWIYKAGHGRMHGPLGGPEAICRSCNVFFFTLGRRLGPERLVAWYHRFGLGKQTGSGLDEAAGSLPRLSLNDTRSMTDRERDAIFMGIGQGPIEWTPLQAANAYATLARGGKAIAPTLIRSPARERPVDDLRLDRASVSLALEGLDQAVNQQHGTAHHLSNLHGEKIFNIDGVRIMGKSGTADAPPLRIDSDNDGRITSKDQIVREGDHAWCVIVVQRSQAARPEYVVVVMVEYGGSGGTVAGPVANQVLHAMRAEGYL